VSRRTLILIIVAAILFHVGLFYFFGRSPALPKARYIPPPNFGYAEQSYRDAESGEKITYREIRVSTKLVDPETLRKLQEKQATTPVATPHP